MADDEQTPEVANYHKDYLSKHRGANADPFEDALNVVIKAKEASELATRAQRDADVISALAEKAQSKAESITRIAVNLSGTAATVASAALRICGYEDFDRAYEMHPTYMDTLTLEELTKLLNTTEELMPLESAEIRLRRSPDLYSQQTSTGHNATAAQNASQSQSSSASESSTTKIRTTRSPTRLKGVQRKDSPKGCYEEHQLKHHTSDDRFDYSSTSCATRCRPYTVSSISPPPHQTSFRPLAKEDDNLGCASAVIRSDRARRIRSAVEHKHVAGTACWHKDNMAACFDSAHAIAPLWEDRYLDASGKMHVHTIYQPAESYTEKKAMRQFQLKLKKSCERVGTNAREQSGHNTQQQLRKDKRNRFPKIPDNDSSDSELEDIFRRNPNKPLQKVQDMEKVDQTNVANMERFLTTMREEKPRAVSPLLSSEQKVFYRLSDESSPMTSPLSHNKQLFTPEVEKTGASPKTVTERRDANSRADDVNDRHSSADDDDDNRHNDVRDNNNNNETEI